MITPAGRCGLAAMFASVTTFNAMNMVWAITEGAVIGAHLLGVIVVIGLCATGWHIYRASDSAMKARE